MTLWLRRNLDRIAALPMSAASVLFLIFFGAWIQCWMLSTQYPDWAIAFAIGMGVLYPLFLIEPLVHFAIGSKRWKRGLLFWLFPPLRMIGRDHRTGKLVWMPWVGWTRANRELRKRMEHIFSGPMIFIALMVLPLLAYEYRWQHVMQEQWYPRFLSSTATSLIWLAFTFEFVVMISIVDKKGKYLPRTLDRSGYHPAAADRLYASLAFGNAAAAQSVGTHLSPAWAGAQTIASHLNPRYPQSRSPCQPRKRKSRNSRSCWPKNSMKSTI